MILCLSMVQYCCAYDFMGGYNDQTLYFDVDFQYPNASHSIEEIVAADLMYTLAAENIQMEGNAKIYPFAEKVYRTNRDDLPYSFRILQISQDDKESVTTFFDRIKEYSTKGAPIFDLEKTKETFKQWIKRLKKEKKRAKEFLDKYGQVLRDLDEKTINQIMTTTLTYSNIEVNYSVSPISLASLSSTKRPYVSLVANSGFTLNVSDEERANIYEIIHTMGTHGLFSLLKKKSRLEDLGKRIDHVPPLQFLGYIFTDPTLKKDMKSIVKNHFKWSNFVDGLSKTLLRDWNSGKIKPELAGFAELVGKDQSTLRYYLDRNEIDKFVKALL